MWVCLFGTVLLKWTLLGSPAHRQNCVCLLAYLGGGVASGASLPLSGASGNNYGCWYKTCLIVLRVSFLDFSCIVVVFEWRVQCSE